MSPRICVITAGHLSTSPRMLKAADALCEAGYRVGVVSARFLDWAWEADLALHSTRKWSWQAVSYDRESAQATYWRSGARRAAAMRLCRAAGPRRMAAGVAYRAFSRVHSELVQAALTEPADLYYGGNSGGIAPAAEAARRRGVPYGLDLEDFYSGMLPDGVNAFESSLAERVERDVLPGAAFLTAGSLAIGRAYEARYGDRTVTVNNTFPLPAEAPRLSPSPGKPLRLYWFSQTIGPGRGLQDVVKAVALAGIEAELHVRGRAVREYVASLDKAVSETAPRLRLQVHPPASPASMIACAEEHDVGLATEPGLGLNNALALSNKALTYPLAGLAVALTDTPGQRPLAADLAEGGVLFRPGDIETLAGRLSCWGTDKKRLADAKAAAWDAARRRWHWEHPLERGALLEAVCRVLGMARNGTGASGTRSSETQQHAEVSAAGARR